jgi:hypothetical protein
LELGLCRDLRIFANDEEPDYFPAVHANGPLFVLPDIRGAGDAKHAQAVPATHDVVSVSVPPCRDGYIINLGGSSS